MDIDPGRNIVHICDIHYLVLIGGVMLLYCEVKNDAPVTVAIPLIGYEIPQRVYHEARFCISVSICNIL